MNRNSNLTNKTIVALVLSSFVTGMALRSVVGHQPSVTTSAATAPDTTVNGPGPLRIDDGVPTGFTHDEAGAVTAAASYTTTGQALIDMAPTQLADAVRSYASANTATEQIAKLTSDMAALRQTLSDGHGRIRYVKAVAATRLDSYTADRAEVKVWTVGVLWRREAADPQADWTTSTFTLVWEDDTWKVETESITSGPAPTPNGGTPPVDATEMERQLDGFDSWSVIR